MYTYIYICMYTHTYMYLYSPSASDIYIYKHVFILRDVGTHMQSKAGFVETPRRRVAYVRKRRKPEPLYEQLLPAVDLMRTRNRSPLFHRERQVMSSWIALRPPNRRRRQRLTTGSVRILTAVSGVGCLELPLGFSDFSALTPD